MSIVSNVTNIPTVLCCFRAFSKYPGTVWHWAEVNAKALRLRSDTMTSPSTAWPAEVYTRLSTLSAAYTAAANASSRLWAARPTPFPDNELVRTRSIEQLEPIFAAFERFTATFNPARAEQKRLSDQLASLSMRMASPSFMEWLSAGARLLKIEPDDKDERSYALYRGRVWSCIHTLDAAKWQLLVDRVIRNGEGELASAPWADEAGASTSTGRLAPEVRRAVWIRDQGKCAKCGNREGLEFDRIVPESPGSSTERNIELRCEVCYRVAYSERCRSAFRGDGDWPRFTESLAAGARAVEVEMDAIRCAELAPTTSAR
jgi:hypothetical protein